MGYISARFSHCKSFSNLFTSRINKCRISAYERVWVRIDILKYDSQTLKLPRRIPSIKNQPISDTIRHRFQLHTWNYKTTFYLYTWDYKATFICKDYKLRSIMSVGLLHDTCNVSLYSCRRNYKFFRNRIVSKSLCDKL